MANLEAVNKIYSAFLKIPQASFILRANKPIHPEVFLKNALPSKEIFSNEPGAPVHYHAIKEKLQILQPYMKSTSSGAKLVTFFDNLHKHRNTWALAFARCVSHITWNRMNEYRNYGRDLSLTEREASYIYGPGKTLSDDLKAIEKKLVDIKQSREFKQNVHVLEECIKSHKLHIQRITHAGKVRAEMAKKKKAEARKAARARKVAAPIQAVPSMSMPTVPNLSMATPVPTLPTYTMPFEPMPVMPMASSSFPTATALPNDFLPVNTLPDFTLPTDFLPVDTLPASATTPPAPAPAASTLPAVVLEALDPADLEMVQALCADLDVDPAEYLASAGSAPAPEPQFNWAAEADLGFDDDGELFGDF